MISQQLQRTRLGRVESNGSESLSPIASGRVTSNPINAVSRSSLVADRQISSGSVGNGGSGRYTTPIDEEQGEFVFDMEGVDEKKGEKRHSGGWTFAGGKSPNLAAIGGNRNGTPGANGVETMFGAR